MTQTNELPAPTWQAYFDAVSKGLAGKRVEIEIAALDIGDQIAAEWLPAIGVTYDPKNDLLAVMAEGLNHLIRRPRRIFVEAEGAELHSINAIDSDGASQIIRFKDPLGMPQAGAAPGQLT